MTDLDARLRRALPDRYAAERELGRGGMSVVYLARDVQHDRRVAVKVLLPELAQTLGADRFLREIAIAAKLTHPRIVPLLDSGAADGLLYYVMPFIDGESLRERLTREKQLPLHDALEIARQVAAALSYAHGHGIVHRDIKPENILLSGGEALVADFGIARAVTAAGGSRLTESGIAVGTPLYMSPEQASGVSDLDARSDVYSLGCVLYEMLAGEPPFTGPTAQAITARKLSQASPSIAVLRDSVSPALGEVVSRALARVPADRYDTATRFAEALRLTSTPSPLHSREENRDWRRWRDHAMWLALGAAVALLVSFAARDRSSARTSGPAAVVRMAQSLPSDVQFTRGPGFASAIAISPDGRTVVVAGITKDGQRLYTRALDRLAMTPLAGTEGGSSPFFSPDGAWIGFFADGQLRRVPAGGGTAVDITTVPVFLAGASWAQDGRIIFASGVSAPIYVVDASGGTAEALTSLDTNEQGQMHPELLPDGRTLLFQSGSRIHALDLASGRRVALTAGTAPRYAASGHVLFSRGAALLAAPFDPARLQLTGPAVPIVDRVAREGIGAAHYAISRNGALVYIPGPTSHSLVLVEGDGRERLVTEERLVFENPQFSPDGRRIAVARAQRFGERADIWINDLSSGTASRLTFDGGRAPVWTPDGSAVTYSKIGEGQGIYSKRIDGRSEPEHIVSIGQFHWLIGWSPDGSTLAYGTMEDVPEGGVSTSSIMSLSGRESRRLIGPASIWGGRLSPDARWLAYYVLETGRFAVYVTPFPDTRARWLISEQDGRDPSWSPDGREVYYRTGDRLVAARIDTSSGIRVDGRRTVIEPFTPPLYDDYDIHPNGRTLVIVRPEEDADRRIVVVLDWVAELRRSGSDDTPP